MLICNKCQIEKPLTDYYVGQRSYCRDCWKAIVKANREKNRDKYVSYDKQRNRDPKRIDARKAYAKTEKGQAVSAAARKKWASQNPEKRAAHVILGNAVRDGRVKKPSSCEQCGASVSSRKIHAHHADYAYPLQVEWICSQCHGAEHF